MEQQEPGALISSRVGLSMDSVIPFSSQRSDPQVRAALPPTPTTPLGDDKEAGMPSEKLSSVPSAFSSLVGGGAVRCHTHFKDGETESPNHTSFQQNRQVPALCQGLFWALGPHRGTRQTIPAIRGLTATNGAWFLVASHSCQEEAEPGWERAEGKTSSGRLRTGSVTSASDFDP